MAEPWDTFVFAGDGRHGHGHVWRRWMRRTALFQKRWKREEPADDPLAYNETASVSVLASTAFATGLLGLAEYVATKRGRVDLRTRVNNCRADLWVSDPGGDSWAFEFKQCSPTRRGRAASHLTDSFREAASDAQCIVPSEANLRVAGVVASSWWIEDPSARQEVEDLFYNHMKGPNRWAAAFGDDRSRAFIYLTVVLRSGWNARSAPGRPGDPCEQEGRRGGGGRERPDGSPRSSGRRVGSTKRAGAAALQLCADTSPHVM